MKINAEEFFLNKSFALFGLSERRGSTSLQVYRLLVSHGYDVYAINPNRTEVADIKCHPTLKDVPAKVDAAIVVTNPTISKKVARDCKEVGVNHIWFQYDTMDDELRSWCEENDINWIQSCVLLHHNGVGFPHNAHRFFYRLFAKK